MKLWYVNVFVRDLARAVEFYETTLGLPRRHGDDASGYVSFALEGGTLGVERIQEDAGQDDLVGRHTGIGIGVADLEASHRSLAERGVRFRMPPTQQPWGGFMAMFVDPEENVFYLDQLRDE